MHRKPFGIYADAINCKQVPVTMEIISIFFLHNFIILYILYIFIRYYAVVLFFAKNHCHVIILELISPVPYDPIQILILVSRDLLLRVVPPLTKGR